MYFQLMFCLWENQFEGFCLQKCITNACGSVYCFYWNYRSVTCKLVKITKIQFKGMSRATNMMEMFLTWFFFNTKKNSISDVVGVLDLPMEAFYTYFKLSEWFRFKWNLDWNNGWVQHILQNCFDKVLCNAICNLCDTQNKLFLAVKKIKSVSV